MKTNNKIENAKQVDFLSGANVAAQRALKLSVSAWQTLGQTTLALIWR